MQMSRPQWGIVIGVVLPVMGVTVMAGLGMRTYADYRKRMRLAEEHAPVVRRALEADVRFSGVRVEAHTGGGGCLMVEAIVEPGSAPALWRLVESTSPPVPISYDLYLKGPERPLVRVPPPARDRRTDP